MGFPHRLIFWIKACISTSMFSISINGELEGFFAGAKCLRQGDPLSPYLFVLCMNVLSQIVKNCVARDTNFEYHWRCEKTKMVHLCFVDDLMLFFGGDINSAAVIKGALDCFSSLSRLVPNGSKSNIFLTGMNDICRGEIIKLFEFQIGSLPKRYLGLPLISTKLEPEDCNSLVERVVSIVKSRTGKFLSCAGRLQLLKAVLFSIRTY